MGVAPDARGTVELDGHPPAERRRSAPDIRDDVVHGAAEALDELPLRMLTLEVHPPEDVAP